MGFKLPGKSMTSGTSAHRSALKMKEQENAASALKATNMPSWVTLGMVETYKKIKATGSMKDYAIGSKERYAEYEARGWKQDATTKGGEPATATTTPKPTVKADKTIKKVTAKTTKKKAELDENLDVKTARARRKEARKLHGRGSKEHLEAKLKVKEAKGADISGEKGGRKRKVFGKLAKGTNIRRQKEIQAKIDEKKEDTPVKKKK